MAILSRSVFRLLQKTFNVRREEIIPVLVAGLFFFFILTALMLLRPARDALAGLSAGTMATDGIEVVG